MNCLEELLFAYHAEGSLLEEKETGHSILDFSSVQI